MSILGITIPVTLLIAGGLLWLVLRAVRRGDFDDWEGPAARHFLDDDTRPERDADRADSESLEQRSYALPETSSAPRSASDPARPSSPARR